LRSLPSHSIFPFVKNVITVADENVVSSPKRKIGLLDGVADVIFKDNWEISEEELLRGI
jgi:hypothetical protein